ncbi:Cys-tRNA(Pro) deacylase [Rudaeicoccus suwonensis]|uniref:Cys-tRNA(Pro) deacylase n=1 Tax=Rudaeicoccus suwonensis TaxID=657409 RepID=UPI0024824F8C|nr:Cys-tRNA(Pro) deacylase [Rudaeicoccus suwonensis]
MNPRANTSKTTPSPVTPATLAMAAAGIAFTVHEYHHDPSVTAYGAEAAAVLAVDPARVFKTLVVATDRVDDKGLVVAVVPVSQRLDVKALAAAVGCKRATLADGQVAERMTGYRVGGISPIGQKRPLTTVLDDSMTTLATVLVSGGRRGMDVEVAPGDLQTITRALFAPIAR